MSKNKYLFSTFLKIGSTAFGGFMALISVIKDQLVDKDRKINDEAFANALSLAAVLPGPMAVNVVSFVGYKMNGFTGALIAMLAVILPSFLLIYGLSVAYFELGTLPAVDHIFAGITPAVAAIVFSVGINMARKHLTNISQAIIMVLAAVALLGIGGYMTTILVLIASAIAGYLIYQKDFQDPTEQIPIHTKDVLRTLLPIPLAILLVLILPLIQPYTGDSLGGKIVNLSALFGGLSLTLFGGGYVMIPTMNDLFVEQLGWLNSQEFSDGIALGQVTPGPILITAAFIGYKMAGFGGALCSTISIFLPPALIMIMATRFIALFKELATVKAIFFGLRAAIIGLIISASIILVREMDHSWKSWMILAVVLVLVIKYKMKLVYLIPLSGLSGYFLFA
ncbi:chromate efflux transporter [Fulvivirgaceae bacterium BMA12]|uniref:Chromate efflux transporter n=1 Tax=Agaribacillus aureus TaxID=3051825 RepID=A0ABT8LFX2_9BACT|nr:chromate efflux transporter [Fulvivirgaceae bacterium BMA12]